MMTRGRNLFIMIAIIAAAVGIMPHQGKNVALAAEDGYVVYSAPALAIPDSNPTGATDTLTPTTFAATAITDVNVYLDISHTWVGDLQVTITHVDSGTSVMIVDRPGVPLSTFGCSSDNILAWLDDAGATPVEGACPPNGTYSPNNPLSAFAGLDAGSDWSITVVDNAGGDTGTINEWGVDVTFTIADNIPNKGLVLIYSYAPVMAYGQPGSDPINLGGGVPLMLPNDADGNGFDTYQITSTATVGDETWYGIFIGDTSGAWVWVPGSQVVLQ